VLGDFSLKGCQRVAGGRSAAKTTGRAMETIPDPERVSEIVAPLRGADGCSLISGGLRYAATTGYSLTAFQAEKRFRFRFRIPRPPLQNLLLSPGAIEYAHKILLNLLKSRDGPGCLLSSGMFGVRQPTLKISKRRN